MFTTQQVEEIKDMFDEIIKREPLTQATLDMLGRTLRPIEAMIVRLGDADLSKGAGILSDNRKCIWTKDGHRITFTMITGGGFLSSLSKEVDPAADVSSGAQGTSGGD